MSLKPEDITIAVTVYNRRDYVKQAIESALSQTVPVRVMVLEDCGPDPTLQTYILQEFGSRVHYVRNPRRRGIFGNWNACIEQCPTPWLSILHDDDYLRPAFVSAMLELSRRAGERGLYYGRTFVVDDRGQALSEWIRPPLPGPWRSVALDDVLLSPPFPFPGQLFKRAFAQDLGGFRETSFFCGEWELWSKIIAHHGAAQTDAVVAVFRSHTGHDRGTSRIQRSGKTHGLITVQRKRNAALAVRMGIPKCYRREEELTSFPIPARFLIQYARLFPPRYLGYNTRRLLRSRAPNLGYTLFQLAARLGGSRFLRLASRCWAWSAGLRDESH